MKGASGEEKKRKEEAIMSNYDSLSGHSPSKSVSLILAVTMIVGSIVTMYPYDGGTVKAPPTAGTLNVTWENLAPETNTFQGDVNLSMIWLAMKAEEADIDLYSIKVTVWGLPSQGINRTFAWDDRNGDKNRSYEECIIAEDTSSPYVLPPSGIMRECHKNYLGQPVVIERNRTRYFIIYLDLDFDPDQKFTDRDLRACVDPGNIDSSATTVLGLPACSRTIDINRRLFYDDMEHGQGGWTFSGGDSGGVHSPDGLWHLSTGEEDCINNLAGMPFYHSANTSWWYGRRFDWFGDMVCNYYTNESGNPHAPTRNWGKLRTPVVDARKGTSLAMTIWHFLSRELSDGVDLAQVYLYDGSGWHFLSSEYFTDDQWMKLNLNLSEYAGKEVQIEFRFDTIDWRNNLFLGWFIDDMAVYGEILEHDIALTEMDIADYVTLDPQNVTARVSNIGANDESNIKVNLTQNGLVVDQKTISFLASGDTTTVTLTWTPPGEATYELCMESSAVAGETVLWNNKQCKMVNATSQVYTKVLILRSYGTHADGPKALWDHLNKNWGNYGTDPVKIDYTSLNIYPITYEMINNTQADLLVLSGSGYYFRPPIGTELDDEETAAIEKYVREGHGFVAIGTAFSQHVPNNNDLVDLVGIKDQTYTVKGNITDVEVLGHCEAHPIFNNVPSVFQNGFEQTMTPNDDQSWDADDLDGAEYCAHSPGHKYSAITIFKGSVMFSFALDASPTQEERQLIYNAFVWSRFQAYDYDVKASDINGPRFTRPSYPAKVSSVVSNIGKKDLSTVQVDLKVDGNVIDTKELSLEHGNSTYVNYTWVPSSIGAYQVCVFADIIGFTDEDPANNEDCMLMEVTNNPPVMVYILDSWGTDFAPEAPWDHLNTNWNLYGDIPVFIDYVRFNKESISYQELVDSYADVLIISSSRSGNMENPVTAGYYFTDEEMDDIIRYVQEGHGIIATGLTFDTDKIPKHGVEFGPLFGMDPSNTYTYLNGIHDLRVLDPTENHPLFNKMPDSYTTGSGTTLTPGFFITGAENWTAAHLIGAEYKAMSIQTDNAAVIVYEPGNYNAAYITNFLEKDSNTNDKQLLYNSMVWGRTNIDSPKDLWIYKSADTLRLEWTLATSPDVQGYRIYRANHVNGFDFGVIYATVGKTTTQWTDYQAGVGLDADNYFYLVRAFDKKGNEEQNLNKVGKFAQQMYKGTNEISIGFEMKDNTTQAAFESVSGLYTSVEAYDPHLCVWKLWTPTGGTLTEIERWMGLRVTMKSEGLLINVGRVVFTSIEITQDMACGNWNFVGYPSFQEKALPGVLDNWGMAGKYDLVLWFDASGKKAKWKWFDPNDPGGSPLKELRPGMGIWIHVVMPGYWDVRGD